MNFNKDNILKKFVSNKIRSHGRSILDPVVAYLIVINYFLEQPWSAPSGSQCSSVSSSCQQTTQTEVKAFPESVHQKSST